MNILCTNTHSIETNYDARSDTWRYIIRDLEGDIVKIESGINVQQENSAINKALEYLGEDTRLAVVKGRTKVY